MNDFSDEELGERDEWRMVMNGELPAVEAIQAYEENIRLALKSVSGVRSCDSHSKVPKVL